MLCFVPFSVFILFILDVRHLLPNLLLPLIPTPSHYWTHSCCQNCLLCSAMYNSMSFIIHKSSALLLILRLSLMCRKLPYFLVSPYNPSTLSFIWNMPVVHSTSLLCVQQWHLCLSHYDIVQSVSCYLNIFWSAIILIRL